MSLNPLSAQTLHTEKTCWSIREICLAAVMTAVVFLATFVPRIPIPLGYAHLGDAAIFLLVLLLPKRPALWAACLGSALSDLLGGFALWVLPTLLIKFVMGYLVVKLARRNSSLRRLGLAFFTASLWMTASYTLCGALLYASLSAGLASTPGLFLEDLLNTAAALLLLPLLRRHLPL